MRSHALLSLICARSILRRPCRPRKTSIFTYSQWKQVRQFSAGTAKVLYSEKTDEGDDRNLAPAIRVTHKVFEDKDAEIIFDVDEETKKINFQELEEHRVEYDPFAGINLKHGVTGVFDIEDLVELLRKDNVRNIFVVSVPPEYAYVNYLVVVTAKSQKHMNALGTFVRKVYKLKRHKNDSIPVIEGKESKNWAALDLGNIALHIFTHEARARYDLETLWTVGSEYDEKSRQLAEPSLMEQYDAFLADLEPADSLDETDTGDVVNEKEHV